MIVYEQSVAIWNRDQGCPTPNNIDTTLESKESYASTSYPVLNQLDTRVAVPIFLELL